jgi:hypothetical protein
VEASETPSGGMTRSRGNPNLNLSRDGIVAMLVSMSDEFDSKTYEERAWEYFLQLQPSIADVNAAAELAFRAVDAFDKGLKRKRSQGS